MSISSHVEPSCSTAGTKLPKVAVIFAVVSFLNEISAQMVAPLIPIFLATVLAAGPIALGAVEGVADAVASFLRLWSGRHADIAPHRRKWLALIGYAISNLSRPLLALSAHWSMVVALRTADRVGKGIRGAPRDAIVTDATPKEIRGRAFGLQRGFDYAGAVLGTLIAAAALAWSPLTILQVIALSAIPGVIVVVFLFTLPSETRTTTVTARRELPPLRWAAVPLALRQYLVLLAIFVFARVPEAFIILFGHQLGLSVVTLLLLWAFLAAVQTVTAFIGGKATDQFSKRKLVVFNWTTVALSFFLFAQVSSVAALWLAVLVYGVFSGIGEGLERTFISLLGAEEQKGTAFGWYYLIVGLVTIPAGLLFGGIWSLYGPAVAFSVTGVVGLTCAAVFAHRFRPQVSA